MRRSGKSHRWVFPRPKADGSEEFTHSSKQWAMITREWVKSKAREKKKILAESEDEVEANKFRLLLISFKHVSYHADRYSDNLWFSWDYKFAFKLYFRLINFNSTALFVVSEVCATNFPSLAKKFFPRKFPHLHNQRANNSVSEILFMTYNTPVARKCNLNKIYVVQAFFYILFCFPSK